MAARAAEATAGKAEAATGETAAAAAAVVVESGALGAGARVENTRGPNLAEVGVRFSHTMKRTSHLLAALAAAGFLGATAFGQAVSAPTAPTAPSPAGPAGAASTTQGTGATGGVTNAGTRTTSQGSELAPGSASAGSAPVPVVKAESALPPTTLPSRVVPSGPAPRTRVENPDGTHTTPAPGATTTTTTGTTTGTTTTVRKEGVDVGVPDAASGGTVLDLTRQRTVPLPATTPGANGTTTGGATTK